MLFDYDDRSEKSILEYAKKLEGKTFKEIKEEYENSPVKYYVNKHDNDGNMFIEENVTSYIINSKAKGDLGGLLEQYYFGYAPNGKQEADFSKTGIELKQTCIDQRKNGTYTAGERLSITNISFTGPVEEDFYKSHVWDKTKRILLIHYLRDKTIKKDDYQILFANLFTPPKEDLKIIVDDYNKINEKIKAGLAHELSESDTMYLGACTKGATAASSWRPQYYGEHLPAKKRNFCFKRQYMDYVLNNYILKNKVPYEALIKEELKEQTFEEYITSLIDKHIGKTDKELCELYHREYNNNKAQWVDLTYKMLGIKGNHAQEFIKAGIVVKAIRIEENGKIKENMSFKPFLFKELVKEEWEDSFIYNYFNETKFFFVIYKKEGDCYKLMGSQLWNMPYNDLNEIVKEGWMKIQKCIKDGVKYEIGKSCVYNNIPGEKDHPIIHARPHAKKAAFKLHNGYEKGNIARDANELPNGEFMTTQSFWLNKSYILSQLKYK